MHAIIKAETFTEPVASAASMVATPLHSMNYLMIKHHHLDKCPYACKSIHRGGASEASEATLTGDMDGSSRYVCMYTHVKPLG